MKLLQRLQTLVKVVVDDVIGEEAAPEKPSLPGETAANRLNALLDDAQARLDTLRLEHAEAVERQKRLTSQWQSADQRAQSLDQAVDAALLAGHEEQAANLLRQAQQTHAFADELADLRQASEQLAEQIGSAVAGHREQLAQMRVRFAALSDRERAAESLENLLQAQRERANQDESLNQAFLVNEEAIARREDRLAARQEWSA
jgi:phage shock protein A